jgi:hypothetical protein
LCTFQCVALHPPPTCCPAPAGRQVGGPRYRTASGRTLDLGLHNRHRRSGHAASKKDKTNKKRNTSCLESYQAGPGQRTVIVSDCVSAPLDHKPGYGIKGSVKGCVQGTDQAAVMTRPVCDGNGRSPKSDVRTRPARIPRRRGRSGCAANRVHRVRILSCAASASSVKTLLITRPSAYC